MGSARFGSDLSGQLSAGDAMEGRPAVVYVCIGRDVLDRWGTVTAGGRDLVRFSPHGRHHQTPSAIASEAVGEASQGPHQEFCGNSTTHVGPPHPLIKW